MSAWFPWAESKLGAMVLQCYKLRGLAKWKSGERLLGRQGGCPAPREQPRHPPTHPASTQRAAFSTQPPPSLPVKSFAAGLAHLLSRGSKHQNQKISTEGEKVVKYWSFSSVIEVNLPSILRISSLQCILMPQPPKLRPSLRSKTISVRIFLHSSSFDLFYCDLCCMNTHLSLEDIPCILKMILL